MAQLPLLLLQYGLGQRFFNPRNQKAVACSQ